MVKFTPLSVKLLECEVIRGRRFCHLLFYSNQRKTGIGQWTRRKDKEAEAADRMKRWSHLSFSLKLCSTLIFKTSPLRLTSQPHPWSLFLSFSLPPPSSLVYFPIIATFSFFLYFSLLVKNFNTLLIDVENEVVTQYSYSRINSFIYTQEYQKEISSIPLEQLWLACFDLFTVDLLWSRVRGHSLSVLIAPAP